MKNPATSLGAAMCLFILSLTSALDLSAQTGRIGKIAQKVQDYRQKNVFGSPVPIFQPSQKTAVSPETAKSLKKFSLLEAPVIEKIIEEKPSFLKFNIAVADGNSFTVLLYSESIEADGFSLRSSDGKTSQVANPVHYRGAIEGDLSSVVSFSFSKEETMGLISNNNGNYVIGRLADDASTYIVYNDKDLIGLAPFDCGTNTNIPLNPGTYYRPGGEPASLTTKCAKWYWETDYDLFTAKGSLANVNSYMQGVFNQVSTLYANDGISISLKTLYVWTTNDPYTGTSTSGYLDQFGAYRTSFDGDLASLMGTKGGGGIAWINGICNSQTKYKMSYSGINTSYSNVPTFSWTIECITHEQGHQLGSRHTHDCVWNGNNTKIDGCGDAAGYSSGSCAVPPLPSGGGTIMSYCHLTSAGINFNLGFGPQPKTLITNNINNASCLTTCTTGCTNPDQPGTISGNSSVCGATTQTYSVGAVAGATSYTWTLPAGWSGTSTTNSISVTSGSAGGNITVKANNNCGSSAARSLAVTASATPAQPGTISGNSTVCPGTAQTYSVAAVAGANNYSWTLPAGWSGASTTNTISVTVGAGGGTISVTAANTCGTSSARALSVTTTGTAPAAPGAITVSGGSATVCAGNSRTYTVAATSGLTYNWTAPTGVTINSGQGTNSINVSFSSSFVSGSALSVTASNGCGTSPAQSITISKSSIAMPGSIAVSGGIAKVCPGDSRTYSVVAVAGITYNWTAPAGGVINSGQGSSSVNITYTANFTASGVVSVTANNQCGASAARTKSVSRNVPGAPTAISGPATVCTGVVATYSIPAVANATSYSWTIPTGGVVQGASTGTSINIQWTGTRGGTLAVRAVNSCGNSGSRSLKITISCGRELSETTELISSTSTSIYPNPTSGIATIRFNATETTMATFKVSDLTGKTLIVERQQASKGINMHTLNFSALSKGIYFVTVEAKGSRQVLKINVQ